jgi:hypothetical protein
LERAALEDIEDEQTRARVMRTEPREWDWPPRRNSPWRPRRTERPLQIERPRPRRTERPRRTDWWDTPTGYKIAHGAFRFAVGLWVVIIIVALLLLMSGASLLLFALFFR